MVSSVLVSQDENYDCLSSRRDKKNLQTATIVTHTVTIDSIVNTRSMKPSIEGNKVCACAHVCANFRVSDKICKKTYTCTLKRRTTFQQFKTFESDSHQLTNIVEFVIPKTCENKP